MIANTIRRFPWLLTIVLVLGVAVLIEVFHDLGVARSAFAAESQRAVESAQEIRRSVVIHSELTIHPGVTFGEALHRLDVQPGVAAEIISSVRGVFDLRQIRAGQELEVGRSVEGQLREVRYRIDADRMLSVRPNQADQDGFQAGVQTIPSHTEVANVRGEIRDSLFGAVDDAGEGPELAMRLADIFGWDLDFYSDTREGDTFRVEVEKKTSLDGKTRTYGRVLFAEYVNDGHPYRALLFHDTDGKPEYFSPDGQSLEKAFLRSPLKFSAAVTSGFSRSRFHPILHEQKAHLGTDYGAPVGTPVQAIGSGRVIFAGFKGDNGNMVHLKHSNGYESLYLHLSRVLVREGDRVEAGDRIGLVGMTGLATGPHLHFSILDHGVYRNFEILRRNLPSAEPVARADMAEFTAMREHVMTQLEGATVARASDTDKSPAGLPLHPASLR